MCLDHKNLESNRVIFGSHMIVKREFNRRINAADHKGFSQGAGAKKVEKTAEAMPKVDEQRKKRDTFVSEVKEDIKKDIKGNNGKDSTEDTTVSKERRWVPVGGKRKASNKSKARGKEAIYGKKLQSVQNEEFLNKMVDGLKETFKNNPFAVLGDGPTSEECPHSNNIGLEEGLNNDSSLNHLAGLEEMKHDEIMAHVESHEEEIQDVVDIVHGVQEALSSKNQHGL